jgi:hypothetical protein
MPRFKQHRWYIRIRVRCDLFAIRHRRDTGNTQKLADGGVVRTVHGCRRLFEIDGGSSGWNSLRRASGAFIDFEVAEDVLLDVKNLSSDAAKSMQSRRQPGACATDILKA